MKCKIYT